METIKLESSINIKKLNGFAKIPTKGSEEAAGWDLYAAIDTPVSILPGCGKKIDTGIAVALPKNTFGAIYPRSGLATKRGLRNCNCVGM